MITPKILSSERSFQNNAKIASIKAAKATKATTLAMMIRINLPAPKIESPKKLKNGSRLSESTSAPTFSMVSSSAGTLTGFNILTAINELIMLIGTAVRIYCPGIISIYAPRIEAVTQDIDIMAIVKLRSLFMARNCIPEIAKTSVLPKNIISTAKNDSNLGSPVMNESPRPIHLIIHGNTPI